MGFTKCAQPRASTRVGRGFLGTALLTVFLLLLVGIPAPTVAVRSTKYYDLLGVAPNADEAEIKRAFKKKAVQFHPDRVSQDEKEEAERRFAEISNAYEVLSDSTKRQAYDAYGESGVNNNGGQQGGFPGGFAHFNMGGIRFEFTGGGFGGQFGGFQQQQQQQQPQRETANLYKDGSRVVNMDKNVFENEMLADTKFVWLVEFYAPWCPHCKQLAPEYETVARNLDGVVKVAAVNCEKEKVLCQNQRIESYPTIRAFVSGHAQAYTGARTSAAISTWGVDRIPDRVVKVPDAGTLDRALQSCSNTSWKVCFIFLSSRADASPQARTLAYRFDSQAAILEAKTSQGAIMARTGMSGSGVVAVCGNGEHFVPYEGTKFTAGRLQSWMVTFSDGTPCMRGLKITYGQDLNHLKRTELETLVVALGTKCVACMSKGEYVTAIFQAMAEQGLEHFEL